MVAYDINDYRLGNGNEVDFNKYPFHHNNIITSVKSDLQDKKVKEVCCWGKNNTKSYIGTNDGGIKNFH